MKDYKLGIGQISNITNLKLDIESMVIGYPMANENEWLNSLSEYDWTKIVDILEQVWTWMIYYLLKHTLLIII